MHRSDCSSPPLIEIDVADEMQDVKREILEGKHENK
jgi:hypothetical protein